MNRLPQQESLKKFADTAACPIRNVVSRFSGKWAMLILCILAENGQTCFNAIGKAIPDISPKVLSETLRNLEKDGLITRKCYAEVPPRVEYSLTGLGQSLMPALSHLIAWALEHHKDMPCRKKTK